MRTSILDFFILSVNHALFNVMFFTKSHQCNPEYGAVFTTYVVFGKELQLNSSVANYGST